MTLVFWMVVLSVFLGFFYWATNLLKAEAEGERFDAGLAILEFGKAYPDEAIRQVLMSADGEIVFPSPVDGPHRTDAPDRQPGILPPRRSRRRFASRRSRAASR
ncbi:MAG: hypothetical protein KL863_16255 [Rhizobium sp.]|nr:hypothetical protein [Rhizobium sp.]